MPTDIDAMILGGLVLAVFYILYLNESSLGPTTSRKVVVFVATVFIARSAIWLYWNLLNRIEFDIVGSMVVLVCAIDLLHVYIQINFAEGNRHISERSAQATEQHGWWKGDPPRVDVLIPSYNEKYAVIERALVGAHNLDYPNVHVHVLDDGHRPWLRDLCQEFGANYIDRDNNIGYKAGNINQAIRKINVAGVSLEYVAVFDADFCAFPQFIERTLSLMKDSAEKVALVQTPQFYFNPDPFQYAFNNWNMIPDDQRFVYDSMLAVNDFNGGSHCCGSSFLVRFDALEEIGLVPEDTLAEDFYLTMLLRDRGWKTVYLNEVLSAGLAAEGLSEFLTQRYRWAMGWSQLGAINFRNEGPGRTLARTWKYFRHLIIWPLPAFIKSVWIVFPTLVFFIDPTIMDIPSYESMAIFLPSFVAQMGLLWFNKFTIIPLLSDGTKLLLGPTIFRSSYDYLTSKEKKKFEVTSKGVSRDQWTFHSKVASFPIMLLVFTLVGVAIGFRNLDSVHSSSAVAILMLSTLNLLTVAIAIVPCFEPPQTRMAVRYDCPPEISFDFVADGHGSNTVPVIIRDISELGAKIELPVSVPVGTELSLKLHQTGLLVNATVMRSLGGRSLGVRFSADAHVRRALIGLIYRSDQFIPKRKIWDPFMAIVWILRFFVGAGRSHRRLA